MAEKQCEILPAAHLRDEMIQCLIRLAVISSGLLALAVQYVNNQSPTLLTAAKFIGAYTFYVLFQYLWIKRFPHGFANERIMLAMLSDILASTYAFYLSGPISALFAALFIWYIIGYGIRFGAKYAAVASVVTIISWLVLLLYSPFWSNIPLISVGWLIAFFIVPAYYFILVKRLHTALAKSERMANYDHLTGLLSRSHFDNTITDQFDKEQNLAIFLLDLDGFKAVNDLYGHKVGDELLVTVSRTLEQCSPENAKVGRLGGDEFIIALNSSENEECAILARNILSQLRKKASIYGSISASIGICFCPQDADNLSRAKSLADSAMYRAKRLGKNTWCFHDPIAPHDGRVLSKNF